LLDRSTTDNALFKTIADLVDERIQTFSRFDPALVEKDTVLVNSAWTAEKVRKRYAIEPRVLNPPIDTEPLQDHVPWNERENGFVFLSRISPEKNVLWLIEIVTELRERDHDIHFHIVGPKDIEFPKYYREVESKVAAHDFIHLEGELWGRELATLLCSHRYGINGATTEQFGIAIGEMIAAGMIPFVPNSGGQTQLVGENDALLFETTDAAVEKIANVLGDDDHRRTVQNALPDIERHYGKAKFQQEIVEIVTECLTEYELVRQ
jgi:glycosyltransferase involved in cell wall biosynthesis